MMSKQCKFNFAEWLLFEEKQQRLIMYHGTSAEYLQSILSNGLVPFPKKRAYDIANHDKRASFDSQSKASVGGIYVTTNLGTATGYGYKEGVNQLLLALDIHPYSTVADEDDFLKIAQVSIPGLLTTPYSLARVYFPFMLTKNPHYRNGGQFTNEDEQYVTKVKNEFVNHSIAFLKRRIDNEMHPSLESRIRQLLEDEGFEAALQRQAAYIDPDTIETMCSDYGNWKWGTCPIKPPDKTESERRWSRFLDQITRTVKRVAFKADKFNQTARILHPIGFTGKDKIICVLEILKPDKGSYSRKVYVHYGKPPEKLISDWERTEGKWIVANKREET